jgi:hypothetical protein
VSALAPIYGCEICEGESIYGPALHCPICLFEYTRIEAITLVDSSGRTVTAVPGEEDGAGGMRVTAGIEPVDGQRRHLVRLSMSCEDQHRWTLDLEQERGLTLVRVEAVEDAAAGISPTSGSAA